MSRSINKVTILGHLGKDADVKYTPNGTQIAQFSLATSRRWKDKQTQEWKEETDWHRCILWRCENVASYLTKGKQIYIEGRLQTRQYEDRDGVKRYVTEIVCDDLILLGGGGDRAASPAPGQPRAASAPAVPAAPGEYAPTDDDVPF